MTKKITACLGVVSVLVAVVLLSSNLTEAQSPAVPQLSGDYIVSVNVICQATTSLPSGGVANRLLTVNYNPTTGNATVQGKQTQGYLIVPQGKPAGYVSFNVSSTTPYINTATTLTASGATWNILYGKVVDGVAQSYETSGLYLLNGKEPCLGHAIAFRR